MRPPRPAAGLVPLLAPLAALLALLAPVAAAGDDEADESRYEAREGAGWEGFNPGAWVRMKRTAIPKGRLPMVTIWTTRLTEVGKQWLTLDTVSKNAVGIEQKNQARVPRHGHAGVGEKQVERPLDPEKISTAGRSFACTCRLITVTGENGRRLVTEWTSEKPKVLVKRVTATYGADGKIESRLTMTLIGLDAVRKVGERMVRCLRYATLLKTPDRAERGTALTSREVPGNVVLQEAEIVENGEVVLEYRVETIDFDSVREGAREDARDSGDK